LKSEVCFGTSKLRHFFKIQKQNSLLFAAERCKTDGTNRKTWFESQSLQYSHGKSAFLAHFCSKTILVPRASRLPALPLGQAEAEVI
jgi:acid phosphatase class B